MDSYEMQYNDYPNQHNVNYPPGLMGQFPLPHPHPPPPHNIPSAAEAAARVNEQAARIIAEIQANRANHRDNLPLLPLLPTLPTLPTHSRLPSQPLAPQPPPPAAAPPKQQKTLTTAVTPDQLRALRNHYHQGRYFEASHQDRKIERERVADLVGVTSRIVAVKYSEFRRQAKNAAEQAP